MVVSCATINGMTDLREALRTRGMKLIDVARVVGVDKATVTRWAKRQVPAERCREVEAATGISRHLLRPDVFGPPPPQEAA